MTSGSMSLGSQNAKTTATDSAAESNTNNANSKLMHCANSHENIAINEGRRADWYYALRNRYKLGSTVPVLKLLVQQSNCFVVFDRGAGLRAGMNESALSESGEMRSTSKMHKGQIVAADYSVTPTITFSSNDTDGAGASISQWASGWGSAGGYTKTPEGKVIVAAFTDSYNNMVKSLKGYKAQKVKGGLGAGGHLKV